MPLSVGTRLGPYTILGPIGAGGMGEVYKARDTRLDRTVAIKILREGLTDSEHRARFDREARTLAALSHPHICAVHDVGQHASSLFLVMELLSGETLAERLRKGALPIEQALDYGTQVALALSAAHRAGIIHRDLKPGNIMLTKSGVKLLDFGLSKLKTRETQPVFASVLCAPTQSETLTARGTILGTLHYMAPEQLEGKPPDQRADIWALGLVLYEMVAGKRAFDGTSEANLIGAILERNPTPLSTLQPLAPPGLDRLVQQCLAKAPDERPDTAHDLASELRRLRECTGAPAASRSAAGPRLRYTRLALLLLMTVGIGAGAVAWWLTASGKPGAVPLPVVHSSLDVRPAEELAIGVGRTTLAWTPDGRALVFVGRRGGTTQLYVRRLDADEARPLENTADGAPFAVSPDGEWVAFWSGGAVRKVRVAGGPAMTLADGITERPLALTWSKAGRLYYGSTTGPDYGLWEITPAGTTRAVIHGSAGETIRTIPSSHLAEGGVLFYTVRKRWFSWGDEQVVAATPDGTRKVLLSDAVDARYVPTGHLVFLRRGALFAVPFDPVRLEIAGEAVPVIGSVAPVFSDGSFGGAGHYSVSSTGTLAWAHNPVVPFADRQLVTVDRRGRVSPLSCPQRSFAGGMRASPDGRRLAVPVRTLTEVGLWTCDLDRGVLTRMAGSDEADWPLWSKDGKTIYYMRLRTGRLATMEQAADGVGGPREFAVAGLPSSFRPQGEMALVRDRDILVAKVVNGKAIEQPLIGTAAVEAWPEFSPDGHWLAYASDVSGRMEVYIRRYPGSGATEQVSIDGGGAPLWDPNGRELFFVSLPDAAGTRAMMAVRFGGDAIKGRPQPLFTFNERELLIGGSFLRLHDISPDGQRFYAIRTMTSATPPPVTHINVILNWFEELKAKVPAR